MKKRYLIISLLISISQLSVASEDNDEDKKESSSPWIFAPLISSNPKLSNSAGALAAYIHQFDPKSPASMFGLTGQYSDSKSWTAGAFAKMYFGEDQHRILAASFQGKIFNDYDDFNGLGSTKTTDNLNFFILRYSTRIFENWYLGPQVLNSNYEISDISFNNLPSNDGQAGLIGFDSIGVGIILEYDSRDNQRSAKQGSYLQTHSVAYREELGGDFDFDTYDLKYTYYFPHGSAHVLAINTSHRITEDAPPAGYSSVYTKAYTRGQYLAPNSANIQFDERLQFSEKWGMSIYGAVACLYGKIDSQNIKCGNESNIYPSVAVGAIYTLNKKEGIVVRAEIADGKGENYGFYLSFGQPF